WLFFVFLPPAFAYATQVKERIQRIVAGDANADPVVRADIGAVFVDGLAIISREVGPAPLQPHLCAARLFSIPCRAPVLIVVVFRSEIPIDAKAIVFIVLDPNVGRSAMRIVK